MSPNFRTGDGKGDQPGNHQGNQRGHDLSTNFRPSALQHRRRIVWLGVP
jgi:hypothetical protein